MAFTEALSQFGKSGPFFAVLFFLMLLMLGIGCLMAGVLGAMTSMQVNRMRRAETTDSLESPEMKY